jgi:F-type H+-transporting ATPase subunit a
MFGLFINFFSTSNQSFFSPFEGFKIGSWNFELISLSEDLLLCNLPTWYWDNSSQGIELFIWIVLITGIIYFFSLTNKSENIADSKTFFEVLILLLVFWTFTFLGQSLFFYYQIENIDGSITKGLTEHFFIEFVFNKDIWSFFLILFIFGLLSSGSLSNLTLFPKGDLDYFINGLYNFTLDLFSNSLDLRNDKDVQNFQELFWKIAMIFGFLFVGNSIGMIPFSTTITSNLTNTFFIAATVFVVVLSTMIIEKGITHLIGLFLPSGTPFGLIPLLVPIEVVSYSFRLVSLSVRLFANMLAGHTLMKVFSGFSWSLLLLGGVYTFIHYVPVLVLFALTILELGVAVIQAYVFVVLSLLYIRDIFHGH